VTLQEEAIKLKMVIIKDMMIFLGVLGFIHVFSGIKRGEESSKFYFDFLKRKVVANGMLRLGRLDGSLVEGPSKVKGMFSSHFQNSFSPYARIDGVGGN
jgi:hypothetical protein